MFRRMLNFARPWWGNLAVTVLSLIAASLLNLVTPEAVRRLTAALGSPDTLKVRILLTYAAILLGAYLVRVLFRFLAMWQAHIAAWNFVANLTRVCYDKLQSLSLRFYADKQTGQIMSRMINDTRQLEVLIAHSIPDLASNVLVIIGVTVMIFTINWKLALFTMIPVPIIVWLSRLFVTKVAP
ncbi:MAG: ABC transporter ATP-binding protein, partial [Clostridia bacterium]|nr:ABC transporter ATP-binding protein [Clostridia bacterium]